MKALLDTNIVIHRETASIQREDIGVLFRWLDHLKIEKCIHPLTLEEIRKHSDPEVVRTFEAKLQSYYVLRTTAPDTDQVKQLRRAMDKSRNDEIDTTLINELATRRVDYLITEDRRSHRKAKHLGIEHKTFTIDSFLEKVAAENPDLSDYEVLSVRKEHFGNIDLRDMFFDSFRKDYDGFDDWFNRKADDTAYVCTGKGGEILAFLYLKIEAEDEHYLDIDPSFESKKRLKIGTFKVTSNGYKIGERFLKIVFDNALLFRVGEIYVTIFDHGESRIRLIGLLEDWGFEYHGVKKTSSGTEAVYKRSCLPEELEDNPRRRYPFASRSHRKFIVPIYPAYHTELFPDSVLRTESPQDFVENRPSRNAIAKVYISRSHERELEPGDIIVFYRTKSGGPAWHTSVATTLGVVENVVTDISDLKTFIEKCRKRSVFGDEELEEHWNYYPNNRPFIVNFLYLYTFPKRLNLAALTEAGIIAEAPRGFERISDKGFERLLEGSNADERIIVD